MNPASYLKHAVPSWWALAPFRQPAGKIAVLSKVWSHHARRSGYHPVAEGLGVALPARTQLIPRTLSRWMAGSRELDAAYQIALATRIAGCDRLLVTNGDFELDLIECIQRVSSARIYAVFHQCPSRLEQLLATRSPGLVHGAICVSRCQIPFAQPIAQPEKTWFVPLGVSDDYFTPRAPRADRPTVVCVGFHERDFDCLRQSASLITRAVPDTAVRLVAPRAELPPELDLGDVELISGLSDEQLREEYRRAWVVLLPLKDSTANNALLEGMACGTPVVVSDVGGIRDYVVPECGALCPPGDTQAHAAATIALLLDPSGREDAGRAARTRAQMFTWPAVREQIRAILA